MDLIKYTVGFLFSPSLQDVVLIEKRRPTWQCGFLNGVGGHIEPGETPLECQRREFREETGLNVDDWCEFAVMHGGRFVVHTFATVHHRFNSVQTQTDEPVGVFPISTLHHLNVVSNVRFLVPMALAKDLKWPVHLNYYQVD